MMTRKPLVYTISAFGVLALVALVPPAAPLEQDAGALDFAQPSSAYPVLSAPIMLAQGRCYNGRCY